MERSLYERLGGNAAITAVVENFRDRVAGDDRINGKFAKSDLARLTKMLIDQVSEATGGPNRYTGRSTFRLSRDQPNIDACGQPVNSKLVAQTGRQFGLDPVDNGTHDVQACLNRAIDTGEPA